MQTNEFQQLKREERSRERGKKADRFWRAFLMTENGKVKSTLLLNSFCMSVVFFAIYVATFGFLVDPIHSLVSGLPVIVINLIEALVPALAGTAVCSLTWLIFKEKRMMLATYLWLTLLAVACFITLLVLLRGDGQSQKLFLQFFALFVPAPILLGGGVSIYLYQNDRKRKALLPVEEETWRRM